MKKLEKVLTRFGIRSRVFAYFLMFTTVLLVLLWIFQIVCPEDFYRYQKSQMLLSSVMTIRNNIENPDIQTLSDRLSEANEVCVLVLDEQLTPVVSSEISHGCVIHHIGKMDLQRYISRLAENDQTVYRVFSMGGFGKSNYNAKHFSGEVPPADEGRGKSMVAMRRVEMENGSVRYILLNAIVTPVNATVQTLRSQYLFIAILMVLLSFVISQILSRRIARPIVAITEAAKQLSVGTYNSAELRAGYREICQLNVTLTQAAKDLQRVEEMQRELIANISHDLRTPLTLIEGYAEVMRDLPGENTPENMQVIIDETKRLTSLVNAVLDYSVGKDTAEKPNLSVFDLTQSITGILRRYTKLIEQDGYRVLFDFERHVFVKADELKVGQVVYNLINNALTYTGEDQTVRVKQTTDGTTIRVEISDSGAGIAQEDLPYIWSRYYRGQKPHKRAAMGTGLGLSIVRGILDSHGLRYGVQSAPDSGTTFWFEIPQHLCEVEQLPSAMN